jgi:hypothetical protein
MSIISTKEFEEIKLEDFNQLYKVCRKENFSAGIDCSSPEKDLLFRSRHRHHMRQCGITFQIVLDSELPDLPASKLINLTRP